MMWDSSKMKSRSFITKELMGKKPNSYGTFQMFFCIFSPKRYVFLCSVLILSFILFFGSGFAAASDQRDSQKNLGSNFNSDTQNIGLKIQNMLINESNYIPGRIIVKYSTDPLYTQSSYEIQQNLLESSNSTVLIDYSRYGTPGLQLISTKNDLAAALETYLKSPIVEYAEPDYLLSIDAIPNDPDFSLLWGMYNTGQSGGTPGTDIDAPEAWDLATGSSSVVIAVIDTGVDYNHEDLASNMWVNTGEIPNNGIDDDGNGYIDDYLGWDFYNNDNDPMDDYSHGTHCSGTIAGVGNNEIGVTGVNWQAKIMPLKFLGAAGFGSISDAILAINYASQMGASVISNSWGGSGYSQALKDAIDASPAVVVCSAGNERNNNDLSPHYPSSYDSPNIISVASINRYNSLSSFSNYGLISVDLGAPGSDIYSTVPGNGYRMESGTSMATPHVSGVAGLIKSYCPGSTTDQIIKAILETVDPVPDLTGKTVTGGRLNAFRALQYCNPSPTPTHFSFDVQSDPIGWINPSGKFTVPYGESKTFMIKPAAGAMVKNLTINGDEKSPKPESNFTIDNVDMDYIIRLNNEALPGVVIAAFNISSIGGNEVRFTDASWGSPNTWKWDFGDGHYGEGSQVEHTYEKPGVYTVSMWARNDLSQSQVVAGNIEIPLTNSQESLLLFT